MTKNLYFKFVYQTTRTLDTHVIGYALRLLSTPRTVLEVFIRKNMGERYIGIFPMIIISLGLIYFAFIFAPVFLRDSLQSDMSQVLRNQRYGFPSDSEYQNAFRRSLGVNFILHFGTWILFLGAFIYKSIQRILEIRRLPSVFDFGRSSVYTGDVHPFFMNLKWKNKTLNIRQIETIAEPLFFFAIGLVLIIVRQYIGYVILISSIGYWLSAVISYRQGDNFILDMIDNQLFNEEKDDAFVNDSEINNARGVRYLGRKPANPEARKQLAEQFTDEDVAIVR